MKMSGLYIPAAVGMGFLLLCSVRIVAMFLTFAMPWWQSIGFSCRLAKSSTMLLMNVMCNYSSKFCGILGWHLMDDKADYPRTLQHADHFVESHGLLSVYFLRRPQCSVPCQECTLASSY